MFGTGIVGHVGRCKEQSAAWVNFDYGERKALSLDYESRGEASRAVESRTPPRAKLRCDVYIQSPLVLNMHGQMLDDHEALRNHRHHRNPDLFHSSHTEGDRSSAEA